MLLDMVKSVCAKHLAIYIYVSWLQSSLKMLSTMKFHNTSHYEHFIRQCTPLPISSISVNHHDEQLNLKKESVNSRSTEPSERAFNQDDLRVQFLRALNLRYLCSSGKALCASYSTSCQRNAQVTL